MSQFAVTDGVLHAESVALPDVAARFGTPAYVYSRASLESALQEFLDVLDGHPAGQGALVCYAAKANSNLAILNLFARMGATPEAQVLLHQHGGLLIDLPMLYADLG